MSRETNMTVGRPTKLILGLAVPLILTNVGQQLYTVADASIVGRGVGVEALAALGATDWLYWLVLWTVQAMTQGFSVLVSQTFGSNDKKGLRKAITMSVLLCAAVGILLTVVFVSSAGWLLHLLDTPENIYDGAHIYLTMMYAGTLITMAYNMAAAILRALGDGKSPLIAMFTAGCLNIVLDLLFVIRFGWGIPGAAAATLLAQLFAFAYCVNALRKIPDVSVEKPDWQPDSSVIRRLCHLGLPLALQHFVIVISGIIMQAVINTCGFVFLAGFTATNKLHGLMDCSASAFGYAASTYTGQNWGANRLDRVRMGVRSTLVLALSFSALLATGMILFGRHVVALFISADAANAAEALSVAYDYLVVMSTFLLSAYVLHTYRSALQGMGFTTAPMLSGLTEFAGRVGASLLLTKAIGERGLFYTDAAAWTFAAVFLAASYYIQLFIIRKKGLTYQNTK